MRAKSKSCHPSSIDLNKGISSRSGPRKRLVSMRKKRKERRKQPRVLPAERNATKEQRRFLAFLENTFNMPKAGRHRLFRLMDELSVLNELPPPPEGLSEERMILFLAGGRQAVMFPRTDPVTLGNKLIASKDWRKVMA